LKILFIIYILTLLIYPQNTITKKSDDQPGGILLPSEGRIHVLFIFAQFPDDNYDPGNSEWPINDLPRRVKENTWVDEEWKGKPTEWSMTDYFNDMSFGKLKFTGKSISVTAPRTREYYLETGKRMQDIHRDIIFEADKKIDFAEYDNWTRVKDYVHKESPDGVVDMIFFVWRNIHLDIDPGALNKLGFGWFGITGVIDAPVDNGARKVISNSGVTIQDFFTKDPYRFSIHEFGHYLIGGNHFHNGLGFWALLSGYASRYFMVNSFERHLLGWSTFQTIPVNAPHTDVTLRDFITTGDALRIEIDPKKEQYFYLENHQRISKWDYTSQDPDEKGVYVLRRNSKAGDNKFLQIVPADGKYQWEVIGFEYPAYYPKGVPVFRRLNPDRREGYLPTELIPFTYEGTKYQPWEVIFYEGGDDKRIIENPPNRGHGRDAYRPGFSNIFSPWSNPPSVSFNNKPTGIGFFLKDINNGTAQLTVYTDSSTIGPPSKPDRPELSVRGDNVVINWNKNEEPDASGYYIYKIEDGREEQIGRTDINTTGFSYRSRNAGDRNIQFKVSCFDRSGEESVKSEIGEWIN
jgi:M6 family metalloprotease-like protein